jgi:hypothetical protein
MYVSKWGLLYDEGSFSLFMLTKLELESELFHYWRFTATQFI